MAEEGRDSLAQFLVLSRQPEHFHSSEASTPLCSAKISSILLRADSSFSLDHLFYFEISSLVILHEKIQEE